MFSIRNMASVSNAIDDSLSARITPSCPPITSEILHKAWQHDVQAIKKLLDAPGKASLQDPTTGETPLHAAMRSCGPATTDLTAEELENAKATVAELLLWGGIWNDVDDHNETPGCVAFRLGHMDLYNQCMEAGMRSEMLFGLMDGYEELSSGSEAEDEDVADAEVGEEEAAHVEVDTSGMTDKLEDADEAPELVQTQEAAVVEEKEPRFNPPKHNTEIEVKSEKYLQSKLTYSDGKLVDDDGNGVMMAWETDIMRRSVDALIPEKKPGKRILNVGFGMGIIDTMFAETKPSRHHVIEAHEEVLSHIDLSPDSAFGAKWEASGPEKDAFKIHRGRWQDIAPILLERGEVYDVIYFDTFGEDYSQLRKFFSEYIPGLLDQSGVFGFFNGLGADRRICYDVYTKVVELHLVDAGLDVSWQEIDVDLNGLEEAGKGEWEGVRRRYWTLDSKFLFSNYSLAFTLADLLYSRISTANLQFFGLENEAPFSDFTHEAYTSSSPKVSKSASKSTREDVMETRVKSTPKQTRSARSRHQRSNCGSMQSSQGAGYQRGYPP